MISDRFFYDGKSTLKLNKIQIQTKNQLENKLNMNHYEMIKVQCIVCDSENFEPLSEKDRYGLKIHVVICTSCGLVQTNPRMKEKNYEEFYDKEYRALYSQKNSFPTEDFFQDQYRRGSVIYNYIKQLIGIDLKDKFVVEIGCSAGGILQYFKDKRNKVFGVDFDSKYIEFGKQKGLDLAIGNLEQLSSGKKPDLVIYSHVLEHVFNPVNELKTLQQFLHKDSLLYVIVPGIKHLHLSYDQDFLKYFQNAHLYHFTLDSLRNCVTKSGYDFIGGNEVCHTLFRSGTPTNNFLNTYESTINYIQKIEKIRNNPFNRYNFQYKVLSLITKLLVLTHSTSLAQSIYFRIKK